MVIVPEPPILKDAEDEPNNEPFVTVVGNVMAPFKVNKLLPKSIIPAVCVMTLETVKLLPKPSVCPVRLIISELNDLLVELV